MTTRLTKEQIKMAQEEMGTQLDEMLNKSEKIKLLKEQEVFELDDNGKIIKINCPRLAKFLLYDDDRHYLILKDNQDILMYNNSFYEPNAECIIKNRINFYIDDGTNNRTKSEVLGFVKNTDYIKREKLEQPLNLINLKNGILNINTEKLIPHDPKYTFQYELPVNYNPKAKSKIWEKFIEDVLYQEDIPFIQEACGYLLHRYYQWALLIILLGHGRNGKTVFQNVLSTLLGENNVEHIPLQTLAHERFAKAKLYTKHANICSEIGAHEIRDTGTLKELTGNDMIFARELYKPGFNFRNFAKLMFACNLLPEIGDKTLAMNERIAVVEFPNTFERGTKECDPNLFNKLTTDKELSGILNWMITGLKRLLKNNTFSAFRNFENISEYLKSSQDPVKIFVDTFIEGDVTGEIEKETVYKTYLEFCKKHNYMHLTSNWFSQKFKPFAPMSISEGQTRKGGKHKRNWKGIKFKDGVEILTDKHQEKIKC